MARLRQIYATDALYIGPTGTNNCTGLHSSASVFGNVLSAISGSNLVAELFRVQNVNDDWNKSLQDVNQFGELAAIDRVSIQPPTVNLSFSYLLANLVNEKLLGLTVNKAGDATQISCLSGILTQSTDSKNYFLKSVDQGSDVADYNPATYEVKGFGNGYISSYTAQGSVGQFPTVDLSISALNVQQQVVTQAVGAMIPAVNPTNGTSITGLGYILPTGLTSYANAPLSNDLGISVLRPGDITLSLGLNAGDGFVSETDMKAQSFNISFNLNPEDLQKLGSKYAYAKVPKFPVICSLSTVCLCGDNQTGNLVNMVNDNKNFNPTITIASPNNSNVVAAQFQLKNAKLDSQSFTASIGSNKQVTMNFSTQISSANDNTNGLFLSGVTA